VPDIDPDRPAASHLPRRIRRAHSLAPRGIRGRPSAWRRAAIGLVVAVAAVTAVQVVHAQIGQTPVAEQGNGRAQVTAPTRPTEPVTFLGLDTVSGRVGLFATADGKPLRWLTKEVDLVPVLSAARGTVFLRVGLDGLQWQTVDVATGATRPLTPRLADVQEIAPSPDGRFLAYAQARTADPGSPSTLVVREVRSGTERHYSAGGRVVEMHWSPDDRQLGVGVVSEDMDGSYQTATVVDLASGRISSLAPAPGPRVVCTGLGPRFTATEILVARNCRSWTDLVRYDRTVGKAVGRIQLSSGRDPGHIEDLSVDPHSGQVLYVLATGTSDQTARVHLMTIRAGRPVPIPTPKSVQFQTVDW